MIRVSIAVRFGTAHFLYVRVARTCALALTTLLPDLACVSALQLCRVLHACEKIYTQLLNKRSSFTQQRQCGEFRHLAEQVCQYGSLRWWYQEELTQPRGLREYFAFFIDT